MEIATKQELPDRIQWVKFSGAAWHGDGFYYSGYDKPAPGDELKAKNEYQKVFFHKLGDPQEKDVLVWEDKEHPLRYVGAGTTEDEKWLFLVLSEGTSGSEIWIKDLTKKNAPIHAPRQGLRLRQRADRDRRRQGPRLHERGRPELPGRPRRSRRTRPRRSGRRSSPRSPRS